MYVDVVSKPHGHSWSWGFAWILKYQLTLWYTSFVHLLEGEATTRTQDNQSMRAQHFFYYTLKPIETRILSGFYQDSISFVMHLHGKLQLRASSIRAWSSQSLRHPKSLAQSPNASALIPAWRLLLGQAVQRHWVTTCHNLFFLWIKDQGTTSQSHHLLGSRAISSHHVTHCHGHRCHSPPTTPTATLPAAIGSVGWSQLPMRATANDQDCGRCVSQGQGCDQARYVEPDMIDEAVEADEADEVEVFSCHPTRLGHFLKGLMKWSDNLPPKKSILKQYKQINEGKAAKLRQGHIGIVSFLSQARPCKAMYLVFWYVLISAIQSPERASEGVHHFGLPFLELFPSREVLPASKSVA